MRNIIVILTLAGLIIVAAMTFLVKKGVSLRAASLIAPSEISERDENIGPALANRLFPDLQRTDIILVGLPANNPRLEIIMQHFVFEAGKLLGHSLQKASDKNNLTDCKRPCLVVVNPMEAQELEENSYIKNYVQPLNREYFTLNLIEFLGQEQMSAADQNICEHQKFLDFKCLHILSVHESKRKMKDPKKQYFFMKKYQDRSHFTFIQKA